MYSTYSIYSIYSAYSLYIYYIQYIPHIPQIPYIPNVVPNVVPNDVPNTNDPNDARSQHRLPTLAADIVRNISASLQKQVLGGFVSG